MSNSTITKEEFVSALIGQAETHHGEVSREVVEHFAQRFFQFVPYEDAAPSRQATLVASAALMLGHIVEYRGPMPKVAVADLKETPEKQTVLAILLPDLPFIVDSVRMELKRQGLPIRSILSVLLEVDRDEKGHLCDVNQGEASVSGNPEAAICVETEWVESDTERDRVKAEVEETLRHVRNAVEDFEAMRDRALVEAKHLTAKHQFICGEEREEAGAFLDWLADDHFVFLGFDEHRIVQRDGNRILEPVEGSALGTMKLHAQLRTWVIDDLPVEARRFVEAETILTFVNSTHRSRVHRPAYPDYITVKRFDEEGRIVSACRFLGLFTSSVYHQSPSEIPVVRQKVARVKSSSGFSIQSHYGKALSGVLNVYPRDELFQASEGAIFETAMAIVQLQECPRVRLFLRRNPYGRFFYCQVYIPKEIYDTELRQKIQRLLCDRLDADDVEFSTTMGESDLARVRLILHVPGSGGDGVDVRVLEREVVEASRSWDETFAAALRDSHCEDLLNHLPMYRHAFPASYREHYSAATAIEDLRLMSELEEGADLALEIGEHRSNHTRLSLRLFHRDQPVPLSDVLPILENMGLRADNEHPYRIKRRDGSSIWIHEFELIPLFPIKVKEDGVAERFRDAFVRVWKEEAENDEFNALVLGAGLGWREVVVFRAYAKYNHQVQFGFGMLYTAETLARHVYLVSLLARYFRQRFGLEVEDRTGSMAQAEREIVAALDHVPSLNEDRVLRRFLELMKATLRTNFYQERSGEPHSHLSFKLEPSRISAMPRPRPAYEIFVYSPRMEGVHLRGGKIARGGLRWSDRPEDYRTEVLGLVKAQQVKNAVIVPVGAKGGFVAHRLPGGGREEMIREGEECYRTLLRGMLDITDNVVSGKVLPPSGVTRHDGDDPYLVVAADKGTATFSDIGNSVSEEYEFWMGDAFASGGSEGYDHKKMGITAKGAWVSVQRHFCEKGIDVQRDNISVVGIGDMAGDVFGNGMLCSEHICLVAAFNHLHIFVDPNPDPEASFNERKRLFEAVAGWGQYDTSLISEGGGIFSRDQKEIPLSPQIRERFEIEETSVTPGELISALLKSPVDLLWNGGVGTFVKSSSESHEEVGDKSNDSLRVNGNELRCRVVGEGGNLGMTQLGRVEYCLNGGACNTDFIDNSAGVDCSDHEVNLKILLNTFERDGSLPRSERNELLVEMTDAVSGLVLHNNYRQARAISLAQAQSRKRSVEYLRMLDRWERDGSIDRALEFLPDDESLVERSARGAGLTRPELSVLIAYAKGILKENLVTADITGDPLLSGMLPLAFPDEFEDRYGSELPEHPLRKEIVATQWANDLVNHMGPSYLYRLEESTGASPEEVVRAYAAAREIFNLPELWGKIEQLDFEVTPEVQHQMMYDLSRLVRRGSRWLLRNCREELDDLPALVARFQGGVREVGCFLHDLLREAALDYWEASRDEFVAARVPEELAGRVASSSGLYSSLGVVYASERTGQSVETAAKVYFQASDHLELHWLSYRIRDLAVSDHWQARARESFRDELHILQRELAIHILSTEGVGSGAGQIDHWMSRRRKQVKRWRVVMEELRAAGTQDYSMYPVVLWELGVLVEKG